VADLLLGLDVGTSSARALLVDRELRPVGAGQVLLASSLPAPDRVEQDAGAVWSAVGEAVASALSSAGRSPADVASVGVTTQRSSVVVWERSTGRPVAPMVVWNDLRGTGRAAELRDAGFPVFPIAAAAKLEAVVDGLDHGRQRVGAGELAWGTLDSFLVARLAGGLHVTDRSCAWSSGCLDVFDTSRWNEPLAAHMGLPRGFFPDLCDTVGPLGTVSALGIESPLGAVVADQQAGMFAHGAEAPGAWKATLGTSGVLMVATGEAMDLGSGLMPMLLSSSGGRTLFAAEGMVRSAGEMLPWAVGQGLAGSVEEVASLAGSVPDAGGVAVLPALHGLGTPYDDPAATVAVHGRTDTTTAAQVARAVLEGVAFRMREVADLVVAAHGVGGDVALPVDGGLARSDAFCAILADVLARPVVRHPVVEATALGAAVAAARGAGLDVDPSPGGGDRFEPTVGARVAAERLAWWRSVVLPGSEATA